MRKALDNGSFLFLFYKVKENKLKRYIHIVTKLLWATDYNKNTISRI
jgi:hypothetical protein